MTNYLEKAQNESYADVYQALAVQLKEIKEMQLMLSINEFANCLLDLTPNDLIEQPLTGSLCIDDDEQYQLEFFIWKTEDLSRISEVFCENIISLFYDTFNEEEIKTILSSFTSEIILNKNGIEAFKERLMGEELFKKYSYQKLSLEIKGNIPPVKLVEAKIKI